MICRNCNKRNICKYADIINSLPREITVNVVSCLFSSNKTEVVSEPVKTVSQPTYRQPIKYESDEVITSSEEEERIIIDINNINKEEKTISIFDYLTSEGENE